MRKKCKRVVRPLMNPISMAMESAAIPDKKSLDKLRMLELAAIEALAKGQAAANEWRDLAGMVNLCESMAEAGIGPEAFEATQRAQEALIEAFKRKDKVGGRLVVSGAGLQAVRDVFEYHDLQRQSVARSVYEWHIKRVKNWINGKSPRVVRIS